MPTSDIDRFANDGTHLFIQLDGIYYRRTVGEGWKVIEKDKLPTTHALQWAPLQPAQRAVFEPELPE